MAYTSAFKSASIRRMPFPALLKSAGTGPVTLYPHSLRGDLKCREKKRRDMNFDPIPVLSETIPAVLKTSKTHMSYHDKNQLQLTT